MKRLILASLLFLIWTVLFAIIWFQNLALQGAMMIGLVVGVFIFLGARRLVGQIKLLLPFVGMLAIIYLGFILIGIDPSGQGSTEYWLAYGLPRMLLLINAILAFRLCFAMISFEEVLRSGISIHRLKYVILGKILFDATTHSYAEIRMWQGMMPSMQRGSSGVKDRFFRALSVTLALILYIMAEAEMKGERIDNLIKQCHLKQVRKKDITGLGDKQ